MISQEWFLNRVNSLVLNLVCQVFSLWTVLLPSEPIPVFPEPIWKRVWKETQTLLRLREFESQGLSRIGGHRWQIEQLKSKRTKPNRLAT
jgi:hypothetical protein